HTRRGDDVIVSADAHIYTHEVGAAAVLSGVNLHPLYFPQGIFQAEQIEKAIQGKDIHQPPTGLICMENALANGRVVPAPIMAEVYTVAQKHHLPVHVDGARLFNAAVALEVDVGELSKNCDSVMCCLSKGLCAPVGSVLAGTADFIVRARKYRKMLGGGMRQAGFLAAAGVEALENMGQRLAEDHANAHYLAKNLAMIPGILIDPDAVQVNMVFFEIQRPPETIIRMRKMLLAVGIKIAADPSSVQRLVTHHGIEKADIDKAVAVIAAALA
ncbi:MAG: GntG family PLP-dependent aldolase, partial [Clostridiales bacterium]